MHAVPLRLFLIISIAHASMGHQCKCAKCCSHSLPTSPRAQSKLRPRPRLHLTPCPPTVALTLLMRTRAGNLNETWARIPGLRALTLKGLSLNGSLPSRWDNNEFGTLEVLELVDCDIEGTLPTEWAYSLWKLLHLNLRNNALQGMRTSSAPYLRMPAYMHAATHRQVCVYPRAHICPLVQDHTLSLASAGLTPLSCHQIMCQKQREKCRCSTFSVHALECPE